MSSLLDRHASLKQSDLRRKLEVVSLQPSVSEVMFAVENSGLCVYQNMTVGAGIAKGTEKC